jgi:chromosome segregation ATPase
MSDELLKRADAAMERVGDLASGKRKWRMCVPVQADDDDVLLTTTIRDLAARVRELEAELREQRRFADTFQGYNEKHLRERNEAQARMRELEAELAREKTAVYTMVEACKRAEAERDALRALLREARDYVDAEVKAKEAAHGDRIKYKRAGDIELRDRIDAALGERP